jgi:hypothetical protein
VGVAVQAMIPGTTGLAAAIRRPANAERKQSDCAEREFRPEDRMASERTTVSANSLPMSHAAKHPCRNFERAGNVTQEDFNSKGTVDLERCEILAKVWRLNPERITTRTIDMHVAKLRSKLRNHSDAPRLLVTVRGKGYMFTAKMPTAQ